MTTAQQALFPILARQLTALRETGLDSLLYKHAIANDIPPAFLLAVASRETGLRNELGDEREDGFHGVGILQVDIQQPIALTMRDNQTWRTAPEPLIAFAAAMLCGNLVRAARDFPRLTFAGQLRVAAAGYNAGMARALEDQEQRGDCDLRTKNHNYGADVIARMAVFEDLIAQGPHDPAKEKKAA